MYYIIGEFDTLINLFTVINTFNFSARKSVDALKNELENIVIPMFCSAQLSKKIILVPIR